MAKGIYVGATMASRLVQGDIIPKTWTEVTVGTEYIADDGTELSASSYRTDTNSYAYYACSNAGASWQSNPSSRVTSAWLQLKFAKSIKITKMKLHTTYNTNHFSFVKIQGSNNGIEWTDLHTYVPVYAQTLEEFTLTSTMYAQYYRIYSEFDKEYNITVTDWQVSEYETPEKQNVARKVKKAYVGVETKLVQGDIIPKTWTEVLENLEYIANDGTRIVANGYRTADPQRASNVVDGNEGTYFVADNTLNTQTLDIIFTQPKKITKLKAYVTRGGIVWDYAEIRGSKNGTNWTTLYNLGADGTSGFKEITLENADYYYYYRVCAYFPTTGDYSYLYIKEIQTLEYEGNKGVARKIKKGYIGVGGIARLFYSGDPELSYYGTATSLKVARRYLAATSVGDYALFGGGSGGSVRNEVDTYNSSLTKGTATSFGSATYYLAATSVGDYAIFGGGNNSRQVNAYNSSLVQSVLTNLSSIRGQSAAASVGNYAIFAGGYYSGSYPTTVDTYNSSLTKGTATNIYQGKASLAATSIGDYALFGGGYTGSKKATVEGYNSSLVKTNPADLSEARYELAATSVGDYALFAGGRDLSATVDTYKSSLVKGTATNLSVGRYELAATSVGNYAIFAGGNNGSSLAVVDIYNSSLVKSTTATNLSIDRYALAAASVGDYALFAGGYNSSSGFSAVVDVYQLVE